LESTGSGRGCQPDKHGRIYQARINSLEEDEKWMREALNDLCLLASRWNNGDSTADGSMHKVLGIVDKVLAKGREK
jgi:hypothetical protein